MVQIENVYLVYVYMVQIENVYVMFVYMVQIENVYVVYVYMVRIENVYVCMFTNWEDLVIAASYFICWYRMIFCILNFFYKSFVNNVFSNNFK